MHKFDLRKAGRISSRSTSATHAPSAWWRPLCAVVNLTRSLALDLGNKGVRVNSVCPSLTRTGMTADMMQDEKLLAKFRERIPLGRVCEPHEVAAVIAFLASEDASFMTGANVTVDGGVSASNGQPAQ